VANASGGRARGVRYLDNLDVQLRISLSEYIGGRGLTLFAYGLGNQGGNPSELVGDLQATSNIEAPMAWRLYELWIQQKSNRGSVRAGLYDVNSEFDVNRAGTVFLHSSHGIGAAFGLSGVTGPSIFPATSLGLRGRVRPTDPTYLQAAVLDAVPDRPENRRGPRVALGEGALIVGEWGYYADIAAGERDVNGEQSSKIAVGAWMYTRPFPNITTLNRPMNPERERGNRGAYVLLEGMLWREPGSTSPVEGSSAAEGLSAFLRVGMADQAYNRIARYLGAGVTYEGLFREKEGDEAGIAVATAWNGSAYEAAQARAGERVTGAEIAVEGTYEIRPAGWLSIQGDLQVVVHPNTNPDLSTAIVPALRVSVMR
jgi:porin